MCESPAFAPTSTASPHKIYSILESAGELEAVMEAFVRRLEREETEQVSFNSAYCFDNEDYMTTSLSDETFMNAFGLSNLIRLQILDFLVKNVVKPGYNIAHYLLGFGVELISGTATSLKAPPKDDTTNQFTTLHLVLELLSYGLGQPSTPIVALDHPSLGNACYKLLETLLMTPGLRKATAVYLRNEEEAFIPRQAVLFSRYPVDSEDLSYTVFECYQKKHLFAALVHDLHSAIIDDGGCWSYVLRTADALISTKLSEKQSLQSKISDSDVQKTKVDFKPENGTDCAILDHLIAAEGLIADSKSKLESPENEQVLEATGELIVSLTQLIRILLSPSHLSPNILPYDREKAGELQCKLSAQILPVLSRLLGTHEVKSNVLDAVSSCALLCLSSLQSLNDDFGTLSDKKNKETFLAGDELPSLAHAALSAILQPTISSPSTRSHAYAILMSLGISSGRNFPQKNIKETMQKTDAIIERMFTQDGETIIQRKQIPRLIEIVGIDATESSIEYAGCKTLALDFITNVLLNSNIEAVKSSYSSLDHAVVERLVRLGLLKGIVSEIKFDDRVLCSAFKSIENNSEIQDLNPIYLFSARVALLSRIAMIGGGGIERLVESGLPDTLISLKLLPLFASHLQAAKSDDPNQLYLIHLWATSVICPLVRLVRILSNINISQVYATSFLRTHHTVLCSLIRNLQDPLDNATLISDSIYLLASLQDSPHDANLGSLSVCLLINY